MNDNRNRGLFLDDRTFGSAIFCFALLAAVWTTVALLDPCLAQSRANASEPASPFSSEVVGDFEGPTSPVEPSCYTRAEIVCGALLDLQPPHTLGGSREEHTALCLELVERAHRWEFTEPWDRIVVALAFEESRLTRGVVSPAGAVGVLQVMPTTRWEYCPGCDDIDAGLAVLRAYNEQWPTITETLCHYNAGNVCGDGSFAFACRIRAMAGRLADAIEDANLRECDGGA